MLLSSPRRSGLLSASLFAMICAGATPAFAQSTTPTDPAVAEVPQSPIDAAPTAEDTGTGNDIVVTGSRIRSSQLTNLEPTSSLSSQYFDDRNLTNVADALNERPLFRGSVTPSGTQSSVGNGVNFINTFGLGSNRTLTLVNGRRVVSSNVPSLFGPGSPGVQVDLNIIPSILIDRVDAVSIGGAPIYGSDAIAGTVNLILRDKYQGVMVSGTSGISEEGDAFRYNVAGIAGTSFADDRGHVVIAGSYDNQRGVRGIDRSFIRDNIGSLNNCTGTAAPGNDGRVNPNIPCNNGANDGVPGRILFRNLTSPYLSSGGVLLDGNGDFTNLQFDANGGLAAVAPGTRLTGFFQSGGNTYQTSDQTQVTSNLRRFSAYGSGSFELTPGIEAYTELLYYKARAQELGQSPSFNSFVFDPDVSGGLTFDTATVPFLSTATRQQLLGSGITNFSLSRSNEDLFDQSARSETELKRGVVGVRGKIDAIGRSFNYDVSVNYGRTDVDNFSRQINQQRFINAVSIAQGPTGPVCSLNPTVPVAPDQPVQPIADAACQPLNLFGFRQASAAALNYIGQDTTDRSRLEQVVVNANVGGNLFDLWAGPVGFNVGYEHRDEKAAFNPDAFNVAGSGRSSATAPTSGRYNLDEVFGEVLVPLISRANNIPVLTSAEAFGRIRHVNNTVNGSFTAWAAGGKVGVFDTVQFRGNFTRSFRAPAITELFLPQSPTFERPSDLCTAANRAAGAAPATRTANCLAFLQATGNNPATYTLLAAQASVAGINGGNPNLQNEKADSYTFGAIIQPKFVRGLTITADYINIKISQPIINLDTASISSACFDNPTFNTADPRNGNPFCTQLGFGADGQIPNSPTNPAVRSGFINGVATKFEGITGVLDYQTSLAGIGIPGSVNLGGDVLYVLRRLNDDTGVVPQDSDGLVGDPRFSAQGRVGYSGNSWGVATYVNYVGRQIASVNNRGPNPNDTREFDHYKPYATVDANFFVKTVDDFRLNFSVTNLFNRQGQEYYGILIPVTINDQIGRRFSVTATKKF